MLYDLVKENRSYRGYKEGYTISEEDLKDLINMARITASGANLQPLKYRIVTDQKQDTKKDRRSMCSMWQNS